MSRRRARSALPTRRLRRESDGSLYDLDERRRIETTELADDIRAGRHFRAVRESSQQDCTQEVLTQVLTAALPRPSVGTGGFESMIASVIGNIANGANGAWTSRTSRDHHEDAPRDPQLGDRAWSRQRSRSADRHERWEGG